MLGMLFVSGIVMAEDKAAEKDSKAQKICPVMGGKINKSQYADVKGKRIYVCCMGCIATIKKDPDKYIKKLEAEGVKIQELKKQTTCPVMTGTPIKKSLFADVKGKRIYVCCGGCIVAIKQDPDKYLKILEEEGILLEDVPEK